MGLFKNRLLILLLLILPIISLFLGFISDEDLSTGGAEWDFNLTWPVVEDFTNLIFTNANEYTRHFPMHYFLLSLINNLFQDPVSVRLFYVFFSLLFPIFLFLNLRKIYNCEKINILIFSFSFLYLPLLRSEAIWSNSHFTAIIFFLIANFFYLKGLEKKNISYKIINLIFSALATYCLQTYVILYLYYLLNYYLKDSFKNFITFFIISILLGLPGLYFIYLNPRVSDITITQDFFYTFTTYFSIIFFFICFFLLNTQTIQTLKKSIISLKPFDLIIIFLVIAIVIFNSDFSSYKSNLKGGGFFFKLSHFLFDNNLVFIFSFILGLFTSYLIIKNDKNFIFIFLIMFLMILNYQIYQKYFEPLFLIILSVTYKNFLVMNILSKLRNTIIFYSTIILYLIVAYINFLNQFTYKLVI